MTKRELLIEEHDAALTWEFNRFQKFDAGLTPRQRDAWQSKRAVPKGEAHQRRYWEYMRAKAEADVLGRRLEMRLVC